MTTGGASTISVELRERLVPIFGTDIAIERLALLAGGASKEAWALDLRTPQGTRQLLVRRAGGGVIHQETLSLEDEHRLLEVASAAGVRVPKPYGYLGEIVGRPAFVSERVSGETIGRRIVQRPELASARAVLPAQMAEELAKIHAIPAERVPFLGSVGASDVLGRLTKEVDRLEDAHPPIELGLAWARGRAPERNETVVLHGDLRVGNLAVTATGLGHVLDWEFGHRGDPAEDVAWPLVRAWRFGVDQLRLGGIGAVEPYLERYNALTGRHITLASLDYWEIIGNLKWAIGALTQARRHLSGQQRSVELAVIGRLAAEMEFELLHLLERAGRCRTGRVPMSSPRLCASSSRPKSSRPSTIRDSGSARSSPRTGSASSSARSPSEHPSCGERSVRSCACWAPPTRSPTTSTSCVVARATSTASSQGASAPATLPRARWCISSRRS